MNVSVSVIVGIPETQCVVGRGEYTESHEVTALSLSLRPFQFYYVFIIPKNNQRLAICDVRRPDIRYSIVLGTVLTTTKKTTNKQPQQQKKRTISIIFNLYHNEQILV